MKEKKKKLREKSNFEICKENNIKYSFLTNVVEEKSSIAKIRATMEIISKTLCGTLGPYGSTTLIQDREMRHIITKDGYDLCNRLSFQDETARTVLEIVRSISSNQVSAVGDGSTSAIVVANALLSVLTDEKNKKRFSKIASKDITNLLNDIREFLTEKMKGLARPISEDMHELETIAKIATNNDPETGKFIFDLYKRIGQFGFITTETLKKVPKDTFEIKSGITWGRGPVDPCFFTSSEDKKIIYDQPKVFVSNSAFTWDDLEKVFMNLIGNVCGKNQQKLLIIAEDFNEDVRIFFKNNRLQHLNIGRKAAELDFTAVDIDTVTKSSRNTIEDIALLCGCEVYDKFKEEGSEFNLDRFVGSCEKVIIEEKNTQIIGKELTGEALERKNNAIKSVMSELDKLNSETSGDSFEDETNMFFLKKRLAELTSTTAVVNVGGKTLTERASRERLIEDAIFACKSTIKYGYITGGNIVIPRILTKYKTELAEELSKKYSYISNGEAVISDFIEVIRDAFLESYKNVLNNSYLSNKEIKKILNKCLYENKFYNLKTHKLEDDSETQVINSLDTDLQILNSTISIIGILGVSNQVLTLNFSVLDQQKK